MKVTATNVKDCLVVEMARHLDNRGFFQELYSHRWAYSTPMYTSAAGYPDWKQVNWSWSDPNVLRGIHCAPYHKLVTCLGGLVYDVAVDLREDSPTYLKWFGIELDPTAPVSLLVPPGCGHGFFALQPSTVIYLQSDVFGPDKEWAVRWDDFGIDWPGGTPILSEKDAAAKTLAEIIQARSRQTVSASLHVGISSLKPSQGPLIPTSSL